MKMILTACLSLLVASAGPLLAQNEPEVIVEPVVFSEQELDQMLAPVALYPDTVLAHILIAATYPLEVVQAARWTERNPGLTGDDALRAVENEDWDPSVKALVAFPDILQRMSDDLDWTQRLGDAFLEDEARITASIQKLRQHAYDEGNLKDAEHLNVVREKEVIVIEPAVREVVYVPYYDTRYIYGDWWWDHYPPVYWHHPHHYHTYTSFYWGPRVYLSTGFFFSGFHWHNHHIVVIDRHHHRSDYYSSRQVVRHRDAYRWRHNPRHRRGVDYINPRTRDYFESRKRDNVITAGVRDGDRGNVVRSSRDIDRGGQNLRNDKSRRNADFVRDRLRESPDGDSAQSRQRRGDDNRGDRNSRVISNRDDSSSDSGRVNREQRIDAKREALDRGNIKLRENTAPAKDDEVREQRQSQKRQSDNNPAPLREQRTESIPSPSQRAPAQRSERAESRRDDSISTPRPSSNNRSTLRQRSSGGNDRASRSGRTSARRER